MRRTGLVADERFLRHDTGPTHPERPDRLRAISAALAEGGLVDELVRIPVEPASMHWIETVHHPAYIERLRQACADGRRFIDVADSAICPETFEIALLAAGGSLAAVDAVMQGRINNAFCALRPPGHHAEHDRSMGFCMFNNTAIAAQFLRQQHGLEKVFILDWDVHHGNGTQHTFEHDPHVFYCSIHEDPQYCYPGTGFAWEAGHGESRGTTLNLPLAPHTGDNEVRMAFEQSVVPAIRTYAPDFILISAGYDAHQDDPLATLDWTDAAYDWIDRRTLALAQEFCDGRIVTLLEGGYNLDVLGRCVRAHVELLLRGEGLHVGETQFGAAPDWREAAKDASSESIWWW
ncbi:MAG: histone deacetylase [Phycisphaerae bacterium]|nr:histone deacetylase [Phycisphaerae bacterium]